MNFTYNKYGYPTGYYNGDSYTFTWDIYGNLSSSTKEGVAQSYTYNANGQRITKTASGVTSTYYYDGDTLMLQKNSDGTSLLFSYNEAGDPVGFTRRVNGTAYNYYFITNLQGDVIQVLDGNHDVVCNYYYDAWGAIRLITDADGNDITDSENQYSIAYINPIRYRGYYYDVETGFYYLQTRYYDPEIGRFISRDSYEYIGVNGDVGSFNLFAYCSNNPTSYDDPSGCIMQELIDFLKSAVDSAGIAMRRMSPAYAGLIYSTNMDGPLPYADVCALAGATIITGGFIAYGLGQGAKDFIRTNTNSDSKEKEKDSVNTRQNAPTYIYRYGGTNPGNLTPREKDKYSGLSFSTIPMVGAGATTIEELNATGIVIAIKDGPTHVSVHPVGGTIQDWIDAGSSSIWTSAVKSVTRKWMG